MAELADRSALVTGASSGIGAATARALAAAGVRVLATGRDAAALRRVADAHPAIETIAGDLCDDAFLDKLCGVAADRDILVANAGTLSHAPFLETPAADWRQVFALNVFATMALAQACGRGMVARGHGDIVLVSSLLARKVARQTTVYAASKHAVAALAAGLRLELTGVRVTEVAPGLVRTAIHRDIRHLAIRDGYAAMDFAWLEPADVAAAILGAVAAPGHVCTDLIELRPQGQP